MGRDPREDNDEPADEGLSSCNPVPGGDKKKSGEVMAVAASVAENDSSAPGGAVVAR